MGYCRICRTPADDNQPYCYECGSALIEKGEPSTPNAPTTTLPYQQTQYMPAPLQNQSQQAAGNPHPNNQVSKDKSFDDQADLFRYEKHRRIPPFVLIVVVALILIAAGAAAFFFLSGNGNTSSTQETPEIPQSNQVVEEEPFRGSGAEIDGIENNRPEQQGEGGESGGTEESDIPADATPQEPTPTENGMDPASIEERMLQDDGYLIPDSNTKELSEKDLEFFNDYQLYLARNEIYARHGRRFPSEDLRHYFSSKSWYNPTYSPEEYDLRGDSLTDVETKNAETIHRIEQSHSSAYLSS